MSFPEGVNPATEPRFRVGDWVRTKGSGKVMQIAGSSSPDDAYAFVLKRGALCELHGVSNLEKWEPRPGERVRVTRCSSFSDTRGLVVTYVSGGQFDRFVRGEDTWSIPVGLTEFEPVFEEPESVKFHDSPTEPPGSFTLRLCDEGGSTHTSFRFRELNPDGGKLAVPDIGDAARRLLGVVTDAHVYPALGPQQERTHHPRPPRSEREASRKAMVLEVLDGEWAGRKGRA